MNLKVSELMQSLSSSRAIGYLNTIIGSACRAGAKLYNNNLVPLIRVFTQPLGALLRARIDAFAAKDFSLSSRFARARAFVVAFFDALKTFVDERSLDLQFYNGQQAGEKFDAIKTKIFSNEDIASIDKFVADRIQKVRNHSFIKRVQILLRIGRRKRLGFKSDFVAQVGISLLGAQRLRVRHLEHLRRRHERHN